MIPIHILVGLKSIPHSNNTSVYTLTPPHPARDDSAVKIVRHRWYNWNTPYTYKEQWANANLPLFWRCSSFRHKYLHTLWGGILSIECLPLYALEVTGCRTLNSLTICNNSSAITTSEPLGTRGWGYYGFVIIYVIIHRLTMVVKSVRWCGKDEQR